MSDPAQPCYLCGEPVDIESPRGRFYSSVNNAVGHLDCAAKGIKPISEATPEELEDLTKHLSYDDPR